MTTRWIGVGMLLGIGFFWSGEARAWGPRGHRVATKVAEARLTPRARAGIRELLHEGDTLVDICNWADHEGHDAEPNSAPWHYVNVPIGAAHYEDRFCSGGNCVVSKVKHYRRLLADRRASRGDRARALLFLVHLVEDVHQPLHVGDNKDRGGNLTQVRFLGEGTNLHRLWDSGVIDGHSRDDRAWVEEVSALITPASVAEWSKGDVEEWADESLQAAKHAYEFPKDAPESVASGVKLGRDYAEHALPVVKARLARAGVRLANELNAAFAEESPAPEKARPRPTAAPRRR